MADDYAQRMCEDLCSTRLSIVKFVFYYIIYGTG